MKKATITIISLAVINMLLLVLVQNSKAQTITHEDSSYTWRQQGSTTMYALNSKRINTFVSGNKTQELWKLRNANNTAWLNYFKYTYTYDANNNVLTYTEILWSNGVWENQNRTVNTYNASNQNITAIQKYWSNGAWVNNYKGTAEYNLNGSPNKGTGFVWNGSAWIKESMSVKTYNGLQQMISNVGKQWYNNTWNITNTNLYHYNSLHLLDTITYLDYAGNYNAREFYVYDSNKNLLTQNYQVFSNVWFDQSRSFYTNTDNQLTEKMSQTYSNNTWYNAFKWNYTYTSSKIQSEVIKNWSGSWLMGDSTIHYYTYPPRLDQPDNKAAINEIKLYPNPSTGVINFNGNNGNEISIYDISGKLVSKSVLEKETATIDLTGNKRGIYLYRLFSGDKEIKQGKLLLQDN